MSIEIGALLTGLLGGLALFLFGMDQLTVALKSVAGARMKKILARMTGNRFKAAFGGAFITSVIQSSSVTTVLVVGFISAGLISLEQSIGVIMGANIGTTITAQVIAFKITHYALIMVAVGAGAYLFSRRELVRQLGMVLLGLGLIFFGMDMMSNATYPLRSYEPFVMAMRSMDSPGYGVLAAAAFTAVVQSSSATTGIIIVFATQGFITLEAGIALAFGANIGTCVTALLAAIGKEPDAVRASVVHVIFNVLGVAIWFAFITELADVVRLISPTAQGLAGIDRLAAEAPRQIANAHSLFNIVNTLLFIGFVGPLAKLVRWIVPVRLKTSEPALRSKYLDETLLDTPVLALEGVHRELQRSGRRSLSMVRESVVLVSKGSRVELHDLAGRDREIDALHRQIVAYLGNLTHRRLARSRSNTVAFYLLVNNNLESIADIIATNLVHAGLKREEEGVVFSEATQDKLRKLHEFVADNLEATLRAVEMNDAEKAQDVLDAKIHVSEMADEMESYLASRLTEPSEDRVTLFRLESEIVEFLKRIFYFTKRIARELIRYADQGEAVDEGSD